MRRPRNAEAVGLQAQLAHQLATSLAPAVVVVAGHIAGVAVEHASPGCARSAVQMLGPAPSASGEPSIWCAAVAAPHTKSPLVNSRHGSDGLGHRCGRHWLGMDSVMKTVTWQDTQAFAAEPAEAEIKPMRPVDHTTSGACQQSPVRPATSVLQRRRIRWRSVTLDSVCARCIPTAMSAWTARPSKSAMANCWCWSGHRAAASRRCCA